MGSLLLVIMVLTLGTTARVTRLITDDKLTEPWREHAIHLLTYDRHQRQVLDEHHEAVTAALEAGQPAPFTPAIPPPEDPAKTERRQWLTWLITCRWCAGMWTALAVALVARLALTASYPPLWTGCALNGLDLLVIPAWAATNAYLTGWLADHEE